jgi:hypothetical protein
MVSFLDGGSKRAILIGLGGRMWDHWSIVHAISDRQIYFSIPTSSDLDPRPLHDAGHRGPAPSAVPSPHIFPVIASGRRVPDSFTC